MLGTVALIVVLYLLWLNFSPKSDSGNSDASGGQKKTETSDVILAKKNCDITNLEAQLVSRDSTIARDERIIAALIKNCGNRGSGGSSARPSNGGGSRSYAPAPKTSGNSGNSPVSSGGGIKSSQTQQTMPEAEYKTVIEQGKATNVTINEKLVKLCMQVGDHTWFPYIAVLNKEQFAELYPNDDNGFDLKFIPSGTVGSTGKVCGIAEDGTHWCRVDEIAKYLQWDVPKFLIGDHFVTAQIINVGGVDYYAMK